MLKSFDDYLLDLVHVGLLDLSVGPEYKAVLKTSFLDLIAEHPKLLYRHTENRIHNIRRHILEADIQELALEFNRDMFDMLSDYTLKLRGYDFIIHETNNRKSAECLHLANRAIANVGELEWVILDL